MNEPSAQVILVVEDDDGIAELVRRTLVRSGYEVELAASALEAMQRLDTRSFAAIVLDYRLPDGEPWGIVDRARALIPRTPIVLVTALGSERVAVEALHRGVDDYITKDDGFLTELPAIVTRITGTAALERRAARDRAALERERQRLADAQRIAQVGSWDWEVVTEELTWTDQLGRILGVAPEVAPSWGALLVAVHPDDRARVDGLLRAALDERRGTTVEFRVVHPTGRERFVSAHTAVVVDSNGVVERVAGTLHDLTERKELEHKMRFADRMASIGSLAAGVAHEINNPLAYVRMQLEFIQLDATATPEIHESVTIALGGLDRIQTIARDLLTFSRGDGDQHERTEIFTPIRAIESALAIAAVHLRHRATIIREFGPIPQVAASEPRFVQVMVNLLINAAQAIPDDSRSNHEVQVTTRTSGDGACVIEVRDTGSGIPEHLRKRIFDPFFTTKPTGTGTGLGLAICHNIISAAGGELDCEPAPDRGTVFRIVLPAAAPA